MSVDVNKPVENPKLKELLNTFRSQEETKRNAAAEAVAEELAMNAHLLAVIHMDENAVEHHDNGTAVFKQNSTISFEMIAGADGTHYLPVYTDWAELRKNEKYRDIHVDTLIVSFDDIAAVTAGKAGTVINPFSDNFVITPQNVVHIKQHKDYLKKGFTENRVEQETRVQIGDPADYPAEMAEAIRQYAKTNKAINAIWLKLMINKDEKSYLLIVDFTGDRDTVFSAIARAGSPHIHNGIPIDMVPFTDSFGKSAATGTPFYKRRKGLFGW
ncbi:MAG: enhanced serine sensitivity protein SseB [Solobacterium sp.]|nr:enhanced serine sensitivity protein SseB [Solobacterium sp.]